ncbi:MAG: hypothetical protein AB1401_01050 [Thermodesulfobacteriota bacterium]
MNYKVNKIANGATNRTHPIICRTRFPSQIIAIGIKRIAKSIVVFFILSSACQDGRTAAKINNGTKSDSIRPNVTIFLFFSLLFFIVNKSRYFARKAVNLIQGILKLPSNLCTGPLQSPYVKVKSLSSYYYPSV